MSGGTAPRVTGGAVMDDRPRSAAYLAERDAPFPGCGYNLRGLQEASCPECGDRVELHLKKNPRRDRVTIRLARTVAIVFLLMHVVPTGMNAWFLFQNYGSIGVLGTHLWSMSGFIQIVLPVVMIIVWTVMLYESRRCPRPGQRPRSRRARGSRRGMRGGLRGARRRRRRPES